MLWYIKTDCPDNIIELKIRSYLSMITRTSKLDNSLSEYINNKYKVSDKEIFKCMCKNIRVSKINDNLHQIYVLDELISDNAKLNDILNIIEFGNLDVKGSKLISRLMKSCIIQVKYDLGGI